MRTTTALLLLAIPLTAYAFDPMPDWQSEVFQTSGTQSEIAKRGEICIARLVRNDGATLLDNATTVGALSLSKSSRAEGGNVIVTSAPDSGVVVANNRLPFKMWGLQDILQTTLTLEAKEGRFRITHSQISEASRYTGSLSNAGFQRVYAKSPLEKRAAEELAKQSKAIAECVQKPSDW